MPLAELRAIEARHVMPTYGKGPVEFVRGEGCRLWDADGREYLDFFAGLSVHNAGHCHPRIVGAICEQAGRLAGVSNLYYSEPAIRLCERLATASLGGKVFLTNSGTEANECAIKLARKRAHARGIDRPEIVVLDHAFHGRTLGALAATPRLASEELFGPLPAGFVPVPRDDPEALRAAVTDRAAAVLLEAIQGEAGVFPIAGEVLAAAREACDEAGSLLVLDEIQTGMGRTGSLWAYEQLPIRPDVITAAKALGGGLPVGACIAAADLGDVLGPGEHGSTFGGGAIAAAAALAAIEVIDDPGSLRRVRELGARLEGGLAEIDAIEEVRGRGLMIGVTLRPDCDVAAVQARCLDAGLVVNVPGPGMLRFLPPLVVTAEDVDRALELLAPAVASSSEP
jgi:acetylornithine/N-succinyldiaminopimelate aminotransferase